MTKRKQPDEPQKGKKFPNGSPVAQLVRDQRAARRQAVLDRLDEILELYSSGHSFEQIVPLLKMTESSHFVRHVVCTYAHKEYARAAKDRAHALVEKAVDVARQSIAIGDAAGYRVAVDTFLKVASKMAPEEYGDKARIEHTGADGGPMQAEVTLTAAEAYERLIKGS